MGKIDELLAEAKKRAEKRLAHHGYAMKVTADTSDYGNSAYLVISRWQIFIACEQVNPGSFLAGYFQWDPATDKLEKLIDYLVAEEREIGQDPFWKPALAKSS